MEFFLVRIFINKTGGNTKFDRIEINVFDVVSDEDVR